MKVTIIFETASDGYFSCYMKETIPNFALLGYGQSAQEAKEDLLQSYQEIKEILLQQGKKVEELEFEYHYDMKSFFNYFNFLNVTKVAQIAGINPSLMRKYTSGVAKAGENQYKKLHAAIQSITKELEAAVL